MRAVVAFAFILTAAGCTIAQPVVLSGPNPADGASDVRPVPYISVTAGTANYWPVGPESWRKMNDAVAPRSGRTP